MYVAVVGYCSEVSNKLDFKFDYRIFTERKQKILGV